MRIIARRARPHTATIYNYTATNAGVAAYQRTVLERVQLDTSYQQRLAQRGISTADTALLVVELRDLEATSGRTFVDAHTWGKLTATQREAFFTFQPVNDFIIAGEVADTLPTRTKAEMLASYRCLGVTGVSMPASSETDPTIVEVTAK